MVLDDRDHRHRGAGFKPFLNRDTDGKVGSAPALTSSSRKMIFQVFFQSLLAPGDAQAAHEVGERGTFLHQHLLLLQENLQSPEINTWFPWSQVLAQLWIPKGDAALPAKGLENRSLTSKGLENRSLTSKGLVEQEFDLISVVPQSNP